MEKSFESFDQYVLINKILKLSVDQKNSKDAILVIDITEASNFDEEYIQLKEGVTYEYEFIVEGFSFIEVPGIVSPSKINSSRGRITPKNHVGRLAIQLTTPNGLELMAFEIRSSEKIDYRSDYRKMLADIAEFSVDLIMIATSPVTQRFTIDYSKNSTTLYQKFAFVHSIVESDDFHVAIQKILQAPITRWRTDTEVKDIRKANRLTSKEIKQFATSRSRLPIDQTHPLFSRFQSIPRDIDQRIKIDSVNTPENRFVKHVLNELLRFCSSVSKVLETKTTTQDTDVYRQSKQLEETLSQYLGHGVMRDISMITALPLNNPVLQRKEGYREILKVWLMYDLAAQLSWEGLDSDSYNAGKRDVASLYEYWIFFQLLKITRELFLIPDIQLSDLIRLSESGIYLTLNSGKSYSFLGNYVSQGKRRLKVRFSYNRVFSASQTYPDAGSWTHPMRPDYTYSFWPEEFTEIEAEKQELMVHIHFDAKYKVQDLQELFSKLDNVNSETTLAVDFAKDKELERTGTYKRADLLKMHAYKDAIRRTAGAYIIYPGKQTYNKKGFHEILPGLGAFPVSPSSNDNGADHIRLFLEDVLNHLSNRATRREQHSFYTFEVHGRKQIMNFQATFPEYLKQGNEDETKKQRMMPIDEIFVLIGFIQEKQKPWVIDNGFYNIRIDREIAPSFISAKYLLLYDGLLSKSEDHILCPWLNGLLEIINYPQIRSDQWMKQKNYFQPSQPEYFVYPISVELAPWSIDRLKPIFLNHDETYKRPTIRKIYDVIM